MKKFILLFLIVCSIAFPKIWKRTQGGGVATVCSGTASGTFTFTSPLTRQIVQRDTADFGLIPVAGTTSAGYAQARVTPISGYPGTQSAWQVLSVTAGAVSGNISAAAGWYSLEIQTCQNGSLVEQSSVARVGVGDLIMISGQSNGTNYYQPLVSTPPDDRVNSRGITVGLPWRLATDPQDSADNVYSSIAPALGNLIVAHTGFPVGIISNGLGNTAVADWLPNGANYQRIRDTITLFGGNFLTWIWIQGENDASLNTSQASYYADLRTIGSQINTDAGQVIPCGIAVTMTHPYEATGVGTMAGQTQMAASAGCYAGANPDSLGNTFRYDTIHFNTTTGQAAHALLWYNSIVSNLGL